MIKICSLDFTNKKNFEADVTDAEGRVLVKSGESVTPELLLRLYFVDIYVEHPLIEEIPVAAGSIAANSAAMEKAFENEISSVASISEFQNEEFANQVATSDVVSEQSLFEPTAASANLDEMEDLEALEASVKNQMSGGLSTASSATSSAGPSLASSAGSVASSGTVGNEDSNKGPRLVDVSDISAAETGGISKGPRSVEPAFAGMDSGIAQSGLDSGKVEPPKIEIPEEDPLDKQLEFDEAEAQRIIQASIKIGKMLNYSPKELKELEQVSYYCNIGISKFTKRDRMKKNFRKMKYLASYEKLMDEGTVTADIAELVKYCVNSYNSDTFKLNSKIPYHHIVSITSFYEDMLSQNSSKQDTLRKMLQLGGNHFNVFILHKFISMMRGLDE